MARQRRQSEPPRLDVIGIGSRGSAEVSDWAERNVGRVAPVGSPTRSSAVGGVFRSEDAAAQAFVALTVAGFDPSHEIYIIAACRTDSGATQAVDAAALATEPPCRRAFGASLRAAGAALTPIEPRSAPIEWFTSAPVIPATWIHALIGLGPWCADREATHQAERCVFWVGVRTSMTGVEVGRAVLAEVAGA